MAVLLHICGGFLYKSDAVNALNLTSERGVKELTFLSVVDTEINHFIYCFFFDIH